VTPDRSGTGPVSKHALWRTFRLAVRAAGIKRPVSPHSLRHSYATRLLEQGIEARAEARIVGLDDTGVTIRHKHRKSARWRTTRLDGHEFMRRFLQHVLPKGFHKVRYSGLWHPKRRDHAARARDMLALGPTTIAGPRQDAPDPEVSAEPHRAASPCPQARPCPCCKAGHLQHVRKLYPRQVRGP
jgi:hypothetical protein